MRYILSLALLLVSCCTAATARPRHWYTDVNWWAGEAVIVGSVVADGQSTCANFARGYVESSILNRGGHSCSYTSISLLTAGSAYTVGHVFDWKLMHDDPSKPWRVASYLAMPAVVFGVHGTAAIHNYKIMPAR